MNNKHICRLITLLMTTAITSYSYGQIIYPQIEPSPKVDNYYGKILVDEFRNLENDEDSSIQEWYSKQNLLYDSAIGSISNARSIKSEIVNDANHEKYSTTTPKVVGHKLFYIKYYDSQANEELVLKSNLNSDEKILFSTASINTESETFTIDYIKPSHTGKYVAYGLSSNGSEIPSLKIFDVYQQRILPLSISAAGDPAWLPDDKGFFYQQLKDENLRGGSDMFYEDSKIKYHQIGTQPEGDKVIFSRQTNSQLNIDKIDIPKAYTFSSSNKVFIRMNRGTELHFSLYIADIEQVLNNTPSNVNWISIFSNRNKLRYFEVKENYIYGYSINDNENYILHKTELKNLDRKELIYEVQTGASIHDMAISKNYIFIAVSSNNKDRLLSFNIQDHNKRNSLNISGKLLYLSSYPTMDSILIRLGTWTDFDNIKLYSIATDSIYDTPIIPSYFNNISKSLVVNEVEVNGHDGEKIPLTIIYKNDMKLDANNPTILYGYGAYGFSLEPYFNVEFLPWLNRGGIYAYAHVRGGGEKGEAWYKSGFKSTKENSWKDFIACAEYLINNKYTSSDKLFAEGASAGAITVGRAMTERSELFKAAAIKVGVLNTVRFENTANTANTPEFGTVKDSLEFQYLYNMDVYHHIREDVNYPAMIFTSSLNDPRVAAWQPAKVVARLQKSKKQTNPVFFKVPGIGGHFNTYSYESFAEGYAEMYAFFLWQTGDPDFQPK